MWWLGQNHNNPQIKDQKKKKKNAYKTENMIQTDNPRKKIEHKRQTEK